jgi:kynurenine 3-monooxygenase
LEHGYKELVIPPGPNGEFLLDKNALHIWARHSFMMIALPNTDATFTCTLFFPFKGERSFEKLTNEQEVLEFFNSEFPDAVPLMPTLLHDFFSNPTSSLATMRTFPWVWSDKVALIGDAAHAVVPFYGQGMNCGFEDCVILSECIDKHGDNWSAAFDEYQHSRKPNSDAIAQLAIENFVEMRDKVADPQFLLRKKIEAQIHKWFPDRYTPQYTLVSFSPDVPYSEAMRRGRQNDALLQRIMSMPDIKDTWQSEELKEIISNLLTDGY